MAGTKEIKRRIKSVKNTKKITKAMELVSASKMKRAINATLSARPYSGYSWEVLTSLSEHVAESTNPLLVQRDLNTLNREIRTLIVFITSNRGLCGAYNTQVTKKVLTTLKNADQNEKHGEKIDFISVGKKGEAFLRRAKQNVLASFNDISDTPKLIDIYPIANLAIEEFKKGSYDKVMIAYTDFVSALTQLPQMRTLLPVKKEDVAVEIAEARTDAPKKGIDYTFEPDYDALMNVIVEKIARVRIFQMMLESSASEHSARMMAMKNASDAAGEMIDDLTLQFNKARQAGITQEISEISAGMASVS